MVTGCKVFLTIQDKTDTIANWAKQLLSKIHECKGTLNVAFGLRVTAQNVWFIAGLSSTSKYGNVRTRKTQSKHVRVSFKNSKAHYLKRYHAGTFSSRIVYRTRHRQPVTIPVDLICDVSKQWSLQ